MVECECKQNHGISIFFRVLIDTWWNVNSWQRMCDVVAATVLIDTWWNVNSGIVVISKRILAF